MGTALIRPGGTQVTRDAERRILILESRPATRGVFFAFVGCEVWLLGGLAWAVVGNGGTAAWILVIVGMVTSLFAGVLWMGMARSFLRVELDFGARVIRANQQRSFDRAEEFEGEFEEIAEVRSEAGQWRVFWKEEGVGPLPLLGLEAAETQFRAWAQEADLSVF